MTVVGQQEVEGIRKVGMDRVPGPRLAVEGYLLLLLRGLLRDRVSVGCMAVGVKMCGVRVLVGASVPVVKCHMARRWNAIWYVGDAGMHYTRIFVT